MSGVQLSLIIPAYNCEGFIAGTLASAIAYLERRREPYELIVVDDGSSDGSAPLLAGLSANHCSVHFIRNHANRGKGHAVRAGVMHSSGEWVVFTDADLAYPLEEIDKVVRALEGGADLAIADRTAPQSLYHMSPAFFSYLYTRHLLSRLFNLLARCWLGLDARDCLLVQALVIFAEERSIQDEPSVGRMSDRATKYVGITFQDETVGDLR